MDIDLFEYMVDRYVSFVLLEDLLFVKLYLYKNKIYFQYIYIWFILIYVCDFYLIIYEMILGRKYGLGI